MKNPKTATTPTATMPESTSMLSHLGVLMSKLQSTFATLMGIAAFIVVSANLVLNGAELNCFGWLCIVMPEDRIEFVVCTVLLMALIVICCILLGDELGKAMNSQIKELKRQYEREQAYRAWHGNFLHRRHILYSLAFIYPAGLFECGHVASMHPSIGLTICFVLALLVAITLLTPLPTDGQLYPIKLPTSQYLTVPELIQWVTTAPPHSSRHSNQSLFCARVDEFVRRLWLGLDATDVESALEAYIDKICLDPAYPGYTPQLLERLLRHFTEPELQHYIKCSREQEMCYLRFLTADSIERATLLETIDANRLPELVRYKADHTRYVRNQPQQEYLALLIIERAQTYGITLSATTNTETA